MKTAVTALLGLAIAAEAATVRQPRSYSAMERRQNRFGGNRGGNNGGNQGGNNGQNNGGNNGQNNGGNNGGNNAASGTCLAANAVQTGSASTGQNGAAAADGQVNSATYVCRLLGGSMLSRLTNPLQ